MVINCYDGDLLGTKVYADEESKQIKIKNFTDFPLPRAFGVNENPTWADFEAMLEERCIPRNRHNLKYNLKAIGLEEYNPLEICKKTGGRMAHDYCWMSFEEA